MRQVIKDFVPQLIKIRHEVGLTQTQLAKAAGYSLSVIQKLESYHSKGVSWLLLECLADAMGYRLEVKLELKKKEEKK